MASIKALGYILSNKNVHLNLTSRVLSSTFTQQIHKSDVHTHAKCRTLFLGRTEYRPIFQGHLLQPVVYTANVTYNRFVILSQSCLQRTMSSSSSVGGVNPSSSPKSTEQSSEKQTPETTAASDVAPKPALSNKEKLKQAVRDYGATVIVFHVTMSLMSLGVCYLLVQSGLDVASILAKLGISESILQSKATEEAGKFVVAYAIHKVFAPVRITITLTATPFIVRKLRNMGILKEMAKRKTQ